MPPLAHHPPAVDHHIPHLTIPSGKQPAIENAIFTGGRQVRIVAIEHQPIRPLAYRQLANRLPQRLRAAA
ncbi:hypothetical protein D3C84_1124980 [compost metagenome]